MGLQDNKYFIGRTIFLVSPEEWNFVYVSKHHYAMELAKRGNKVFFIQPPRLDMDDCIKVQRVDKVENLFLVDYKPLAKGMQYYPYWLKNFLERKFLRNLERIAQVKFDTVWNFENSRFYDFRFAPEGVTKIYFQVDENQNFHPLKAAKTSEIAFAINNYILNLIKPVQQNSFKITHSLSGELPESSKNILRGTHTWQLEKPLRAVYIGNIDSFYIQKDLLLKLVELNPDVQFDLVGPCSEALAETLSSYTNILLKGKVEFNEIAGFLSRADILLLFYDDSFLGSPHKLIEYLASGKVILSTRIMDFSDMGDLVNIAETHQEYLARFQDIKQNISQYNTLGNMQKRISFVVDKTYTKQLDAIEDKIGIVKAQK